MVPWVTQEQVLIQITIKAALVSIGLYTTAVSLATVDDVNIATLYLGKTSTRYKVSTARTSCSSCFAKGCSGWFNTVRNSFLLNCISQ
jgi:hypothetical protein